MELRAELTGRDGQKQALRVRCPPEAGAGGELRGLLRGLGQLQEQVTALLAPLVQQESGRAPAGTGPGAGPRGDVGEDDEEEEEDEDEENNIDVRMCADGPPLKRTKSGHS